MHHSDKVRTVKNNNSNIKSFKIKKVIYNELEAPISTLSGRFNRVRQNKKNGVCDAQSIHQVAENPRVYSPCETIRSYDAPPQEVLEKHKKSKNLDIPKPPKFAEFLKKKGKKIF